ncbi:MAG: phosphoribosyltransferase [Synechococcus sp.]
MVALFLNRREAGQCLASRLASLANRADVVVVALPRGGVPMGWEIARALAVPLDVCIVRKLGVPQQPELAFGAIGSGDVIVLNPDVIDAWMLSADEIDRVKAREQQELHRRERLYCQGRQQLQLTGNVVILVDDGVATGATVKAAISIVRQHHPRTIVVATPVAPPTVCAELQAVVDCVVCLAMPATFRAIGEWFVNFEQLSDEEVRYCLRKTTAVRPPELHVPRASLDLLDEQLT